MNQPEYEKFQGDAFAALRKEFPSVQSCGDCELFRLALCGHDTPVSAYSKNELERMVKALRQAALVRKGADSE